MTTKTATKLVTLKALARRLGLSLGMVRRCRSFGLFDPAERVGRRVFYDVGDARRAIKAAVADGRMRTPRGWRRPKGGRP